MAAEPSSEAGTGINQVKEGTKGISGRGKTWAKIPSYKEAVSDPRGWSSEKEATKCEMR